MSRKRKFFVFLLVIVLGIQLIQPRRNKSKVMLANDISNTVHVPQEINRILNASCFDCHSNNTDYPWYSSIQPFGWMLARHVRKGKSNLNFSEFGSYSLRKQRSKLDAIKNSIEDGTMPLSSYLLLHSEAKLSENEKEQLIEWSKNAERSVKDKR